MESTHVQVIEIFNKAKILSTTSTINSGVLEQHDFEHSWIFENMHHKEIRAKICTLARPTSAILCFLKDIGFELFSFFFSFSVRVGDECDVEVVVVDKSLSSETEGNEFFLFGFDCKDTSLIDLGMVPYVFWRICSSSSEK